MTLRAPVTEFLANGPLPDENQDPAAIDHAAELLEAIPAPVTDEEAHALLAGFGPDDCFGVAWTLLHLIETAPGAKTAQYPADSDNFWLQRLRDRVENLQRHTPPTE